MSETSLDTVKNRLRVTHSLDDSALQQMLDAAEDEALRFLNRSLLPTLPVDYPSSEGEEENPSSDDPVAPSVTEAICLLVSASYDAHTPEAMMALRRAAETKLMPYRVGLGV